MLENKILSVFRAVILAVLVVMMILLGSVYIIRSQNLKINSSNMLTASDMLMFRNFDEAVSGYDRDRYLPEFLGYKLSDSTPIGIFSNSDIISDMYETVFEYFGVLFSNKAHAVVLSRLDGDALWNQCIASDSYIYMRYRADIPSAIFYNYINESPYPDYTDMYDGDVTNISEMFVIFDSNTSHIVTRSALGEVTLFALKDDGDSPVFVTSLIAAYNNNKDFVDFVFYKNASDYRYKNLDISDTAIVLKNEISSRQITVSTKLYSFIKPEIISVGLNASESPFLGIFGYNPDKISKYATEDGSYVYVDSHGKTEIWANGNVSYTGTQGIELSEFLGYKSVSGSYSVSEMLNACGIIIEKTAEVSPSLLGGDGIPVLNKMYYADDALFIEFSYAFENIALVDWSGEDLLACRFVLRNDMLSEFYIKSLDITDMKQSVQSYPQSWTAENIGGMLSDDVSYINARMRPVYAITDMPDALSETQFLAEWSIIGLAEKTEEESKGAENELE